MLLFQAFLAPALFVSATALLILSINVRLMGIVSRLRQYVHAKHGAAKNGHVAEADAYTSQIESIEQRAELIRRCFLLALISLAGTIASCLLLGLGISALPDRLARRQTGSNSHARSQPGAGTRTTEVPSDRVWAGFGHSRKKTN
jgi:hypothetical protein